MKHTRPDPNCENCDGSGEVSIPAHVDDNLGSIIDECVRPCVCTFPEKEEKQEEYD